MGSLVLDDLRELIIASGSSAPAAKGKGCPLNGSASWWRRSRALTEAVTEHWNDSQKPGSSVTGQMDHLIQDVGTQALGFA